MSLRLAALAVLCTNVPRMLLVNVKKSLKTEEIYISNIRQIEPKIRFYFYGPLPGKKSSYNLIT